MQPFPRLRILLSAHELSPNQGSECAEGWNLATRLAKYHDVTVLYAAGSQFEGNAYRVAVEKFQSSRVEKLGEGVGGVEMDKMDEMDKMEDGWPEFIAVPQPWFTMRLAALNKILSRRTTGIGIPFLYYWGYRLWQRSAYKKARQLTTHNSKPDTRYPTPDTRYPTPDTRYPTPDTRHPNPATHNPKPKTHNFDIVHHLTQITFREPGYLWKLGIPFVWGPTGGMESVSISFARSRGLKIALKEIVRELVNGVTFKTNSRIQHAISESSLIYAFSEKDRDSFKEAGAERVELMLDSGSDVEGKGQKAKGKNLDQGGGKLQVIWVGQLVERKALDILIEAVAGSEILKNNCEVTVVGEGPLWKKYEQKLFNSSTLELFNFTGPIPHDQVFELMKQAGVLVHTSYREAASNVIPEALSVGLPVICHDFGGMSVAINDSCGVKIPLVSFDSSVLGFRAVLEEFSELRAQSSVKLEGLREGALKRASEISWDAHAARIAEDYLRVAGL